MASGIEDVFAYGTLLFPEIMQAVTRARFPSEPATLAGYVRRRLRRASYPGLAPDPSSITSGVVYRGVNAAALERLDRFEGELYARERVVVDLATGERVAALAYVVRPEHRGELCDEPWDPQAFRQSPDFDRFAAG